MNEHTERKSTDVLNSSLLLLLSAVCCLLMLITSVDAQNPIVAENQNTGTTAWQLGQPGYQISYDDTGAIKGYASAVSVNQGQGIKFYVSTNPAQSYTIDVYRVGWYQGTGGRLMQHIGPLSGVLQPSCPTDATTGMIACSWTSSYTLNVPSNWTTGIYLAVLTNSQNWQNYIMFAVRNDSRAGAFLYQQPVLTYQAYNNWPADHVHGKDLYDGDSSGGNTVAGTPRAVKVSFDRPYTWNGAGGEASDFTAWEMYLVHWLERNGYDVSYTTDVDVSINPNQVLQYKALISPGHDEYWTLSMYDAFQQARDAGVHLGFLGANDIYWQVRLEANGGDVKNRVVVCYKSASIDPVQGPTTTVRWSDSYLKRPEQMLKGLSYGGSLEGANTPNVNYVVKNASHWVYSSTGFQEGSVVPLLVGYEIDAQDLVHYPPPTGSGYTILSNSPFTDHANNNLFAQSSIYQATSGAWVFDAGSISWGRALDQSGYLDPRIQQTTANVLNTFLTGSLPQQNLTPPINLSGQQTSANEIDLTWTNTSNLASQLVLERALDSRFTTAVTDFTLPGNAAYYADASVTPNTYYYQVLAQNALGSSGYSMPVKVVMLPTAPTSLSALGVSNQQINLTWINTATNANSYQVQRSTDQVSWNTVTSGLSSSTTGYNNVGLTPLTSYCYRVQANNSAGSSEFSNVACASTTNDVVYASDNFNRTSVNSWGTALVGGSYISSGGTAANFLVNGTTGTVVIDTSGERHLRLPGAIQQDMSAAVRVTTDKTPTGGYQKPSILLRRVDSNNLYRAEMDFPLKNGVLATIYARAGGSDVLLASVTTAITYTPGSFYWMRAQVQGINPTVINMKIWPANTQEPSIWTLTATDSSPVLQTGAPFALFNSVSSATTNLPITFSWHDLYVTPPQ